MKLKLWSRSYHLLKVPLYSFWPLTGSISAFLLTSGSVYWWHKNFSFVVFISVFLVLVTMLFWWRDMIKEGFFGGHSISFMKFLQFGMMLFILSEVCFFGSFFWGFFHMCWSPAEEIGSVWPPVKFFEVIIDPFSVPLLNTMILLSSGVSVTACHFYLLVSQNSKKSFLSSLFLFITVLLGFMFLALQLEEYMNSFLSFKSSVYGSSFFILTGFHGLHVTIGAMVLSVVYIRLIKKSLSIFDHMSFEAAAWYWHFVDVVWLFLFIFVYWLGSPM